MTIKNYSKQCLMISAGIMVLALLLSLFGMGWDEDFYQFTATGQLQVRWQR